MNEILLYGEVGSEILPRDVVEQLKLAGGEPVAVRVDSPGGDIYAGISIMNALRGYSGDMTVYIDALAASSASLIAVGSGARVVARPNAEVMIHHAWAAQVGNSSDMSKSAADLDRADLKQAAIYAERAGGTPEQWLELMAAETWFTAQEALDAGLIDAIEDAKTPAVAASVGPSRVMASFKYSSRSAAPPPTFGSRSESVPENTTPSDGQKGDAVSIFEKLAQELGTSEDAAKTAFAKILAETVKVNTEVEISYPEDTQVVPTGKATITPVGEVPSGLTFTLGEVADGWTAEVAEDTGVITVTAPNAEPGEQLALTVTVQSGEGEPTELTAGVTIKAAADDEPEPTSAEPAAPGTPGELAGDAVSLDRETYNELKAAAKFGWQAMERDKEAKLVSEVDAWVKDGRISASLRGKAVAAMKRDPQIARDLYGSNPKDTVPRAELGYGVDDTADGEPGLPSLDDLFKRAEERRATHK